MKLLCPVCKVWVTQNPTENNEYIPAMREKHDQHLYENYIMNIVVLDEVDKLLREYISIH